MDEFNKLTEPTAFNPVMEMKKKKEREQLRRNLDDMYCGWKK